MKQFKSLDDIWESNEVLVKPTAVAVSKNRNLGAVDSALVTALSADAQDLGRAVEAAWESGDMPALNAALKALAATAPDFMDSPELETLLGGDLVQALLENS